MTKNVEICMADILVQLIDECVTIPSDVLDILLANFTSKAAVSRPISNFHQLFPLLTLSKHSSPFLSLQKNNPAAHSLTIEVCDATKDRLQKYIAQVSQKSECMPLERGHLSLSDPHLLLIT